MTSTKREQGEEFKIQLLALDLALEVLKKKCNLETTDSLSLQYIYSSVSVQQAFMKKLFLHEILKLTT